jgi:hypothetical protein
MLTNLDPISMVPDAHLRRHPVLRAGPLLIVWMAFAAAAAFAQAPSGGNANDLVRKVIQNELEASDDGAFMFRLRRRTPNGGSQTKELVETKEGRVARLIAIDDKPLTPEQRAQDDHRLQYLLSHPEEQQRKLREQKQDTDRVLRMFKALPDAFLYQHDGTEPSKHGQLLRLKFRPDPNYDPPSRELSVFRGMEGTLWVDASSLRLARIEGRLFREVTFGWGILGHLDKGGYFTVEQSDVGHGRWEATFMDIQFNGKALLFKTISLKEQETATHFRPVPSNLSFAQGVDLLKKSNSVVAENHAGRQ